MDKEISMIVLSGKAGSGKSTVGKALAEKLGWAFESVGNYTRAYAMEEYGLGINEFQELCKTNPEIDKRIDNSFVASCNKTTDLVIDWRLGFKFLPDAYSVYLDVPDHVAVQRIQNRKDEFKGVDEASVLSIMSQRNMAMRTRFLDVYGVDFTAPSNYLLTINTGDLNIAACVDLIIDRYKQQ